ncbi:MAG TPA: anti-virulence regulator CigR family protein [Gemmatimonadaceae bacterium]|nr:anti-virulence regulator CigR family protein [Gemmatimonadaceae bacterium]
MMKTAVVGASLLALSVMIAAPASAQGNGRGRGQSASAGRGAHPAPAKGAVDVEIRIIRDYFAASGQKPKPLPPGIAKNLARGKPLPPGIAKKLPPDGLLRRLPARSGTRWILAGDVVLLIDVSDVVVDIVKAIL